jgi:hypothetical protein
VSFGDLCHFQALAQPSNSPAGDEIAARSIGANFAEMHRAHAQPARSLAYGLSGRGISIGLIADDADLSRSGRVLAITYVEYGVFY